MFISQFQQSIHPLAIEVCRTLQEAGYQAFIVGGCVRDLYLHIAPKDWDITTNAAPEQVMQLFPRTLPTGLQHGTVTVCMAEGVENHFEVTTFRVEGKYLDGRRPEEVRFVQSVEEDLARRDLTINAIAYDPISNVMTDPFGGWQDIQDGIIRAVGNPAERFQEDGLRIMRVARFAARFDYQVDLATFEGMQASLETLKKVSKERVSDELRKTLTSAHADYGMTILAKSGALNVVCPLLGQLELAILQLQECKGNMETCLAFYYSKFPIGIVELELISLKLSGKEIKRITFMLKLRAVFLGFQQSGTVVSYRQFMAVIKNDSPDPWEYTLEQFITFAKALGLPVEMLDAYQGKTTVYSRKELAIDGIDLMSNGFKPGPVLKMLLDGCYLEILNHPEHNTKNYLLNTVVKRLL
jgi:tRNA nucleotidyltransferase (CCA-adding enzyme)